MVDVSSQGMQSKTVGIACLLYQEVPFQISINISLHPYDGRSVVSVCGILKPWELLIYFIKSFLCKFQLTYLRILMVVEVSS